MGLARACATPGPAEPGSWLGMARALIPYIRAKIEYWPASLFWCLFGYSEAEILEQAWHLCKGMPERKGGEKNYVTHVNLWLGLLVNASALGAR